MVRFGNDEAYDVDKIVADAISVGDGTVSTAAAAVGGLKFSAGDVRRRGMFDEGTADSARKRILLMVAARTPPFQRQSRQKARELSRRKLGRGALVFSR